MIEVRLDPARHRLDGRQTIVYRSGADTSLTAMYLHAYPNAFSHPYTTYGREMIKLEEYDVLFADPGEFGWMAIDSVHVDGAPASILLDETLARIDLPKPLAPGDSASISLRFAVRVPEVDARLMRSGDRYSLAQWYPKLVVHDDEGWHLDRHHYLAEFYGEFATYDVEITLPDRLWVGSTGLLIDAEGGDNQIPLMASRTATDSVTVTWQPAPAPSLRARWPAGGLEVVTDMAADRSRTPIRAAGGSDGTASLRVPRGAPLHYRFEWRIGEEAVQEEADIVGAPGPLHPLIANADTTVIDSIRAITAAPAPADTVLSSTKTLRFWAVDVHDFAWVAAPDYVRADSLVDGIAVRALVFREDQDRWKNALGATVDALRRNASLLGPYVWPQITTAEAFCGGGGGMEYPMLTMNEPDSHSRYLREPDNTIAHETAHQWAYAMLGNDERVDPWLDEGFTQYLEIRHMDEAYRDGLFRHAKHVRWVSPRRAFDRDEQDYLARAWARDEAPMSTPAEGNASWRQYAVSAYTKPAMMLHTLRGVLGDSTFQRFLHAYYRRGILHHVRPMDVYAAAREVSGIDLGSFFEAWVDGVERAGFAIDGVRREREGDRHRATVGIKRTEGMVLPVTVEGRFADGARQEVRVLPRETRTQVVFESTARLTEAILDPRHEIVEMNRLDNRTGFLPPIRWKPLYDVPSSEAISAMFGPTIWHGRAEGLRLGAWVKGTYLPSNDFPDGIRGFEGGLGRGAKNGATWYRLGAWRRVETIGARGYVRGRVVRDAGLARAEVWAGNWATAPGRLHPFRRWRAGVAYRDRDEIAPVDARYWSLGRVLEVGATVALETKTPRHDESLTLALRHGASAFRGRGDSAPDASYDRFSLVADQSLRLDARGKWIVRWRGVAGSVYRRVPREQLFDIAEETRLDALEAFYANDRGPLRSTGRFLVEGGGGLRGYHDRAVLGRTIATVSLEVQKQGWPVRAFLDMGRAGAAGAGEEGVTPLHPLVGRTIADAGIVCSYGPVKLTLPLYVSDPPRGESPVDQRWLFSLGIDRLPLP